MQAGFFVATAAMIALAFLTPESSYLYEAIVMVILGLGMGVAMPVINLAIQSEFSQRELGVVTSSSQLFRSLGSTIGTAVFGAMLTAGLMTQVAGLHNTAYIESLSEQSSIERIGDLNDPSTLVTLNMPAMRDTVGAAATEQFAQLPAAQQEQAQQQFTATQDEFSGKVTQAFSESLRGIFIAASAMLGIAAILSCTLKERQLKETDPAVTPGEV